MENTALKATGRSPGAPAGFVCQVNSGTSSSASCSWHSSSSTFPLLLAENRVCVFVSKNHLLWVAQNIEWGLSVLGEEVAGASLGCLWQELLWDRDLEGGMILQCLLSSSSFCASWSPPPSLRGGFCCVCAVGMWSWPWDTQHVYEGGWKGKNSPGLCQELWQRGHLSLNLFIEQIVLGYLFQLVLYVKEP